MIKIENNILLSSRIVTGWRFCIDYRKLNKTTQKDHFPLPFLDQMLDKQSMNIIVSWMGIPATIKSL